MRYEVTVWTTNDGFDYREFAGIAEACAFISEASGWAHFSGARVHRVKAA